MTPWSRSQFLTMYDLAERSARLADLGRRIGRTAKEVDLALWRTLGAGTVTDALFILNGQGHGEAKNLAVAAK